MKWVVVAVGLLLSYQAGATPAVCRSNQQYIPVEKQPLDSVLYIITDCKGKKDYILGTLHSSDKEIVKSISFAFKFLKNADVAWFELKHEPGDEMKANRYMFLPTGSEGLKAKLGEEDFSRLVALFRTAAPNMPEAFLDRYKPWAASIALQILSIDTSGAVMDDVVQSVAKRHKIDVKGLETVQKQFNIFERFSEEEQLKMLRDAIEQFDDNEAMSNRLVEYYKSGNLREIYKLSEETFVALSDETISSKLEKWLVHDRNRNMANILIDEIEDKDVFIAVGALHLPGDTGLLQAFEDAGYRIEAVKR